MPLSLVITDAGRNAITTAVGEGGAVILAQVAVGSGVWSRQPVGTDSNLIASIKQITPQGSSMPTTGSVHMTASDTSGDAYSVNELGIFTSLGVLFAISSPTTAFTGSTTASSTTITGIATGITSAFAIGDTITGAGIPSSTTITAITSTTLTLSHAATASATVTLTRVSASPMFIKSAGVAALLAFDILLTGVTPGTVTIGDASFQYPPASDTEQGVVELATDADMTAGVSTQKAVVPSRLMTWVNSFLLRQANNLSDLANLVTARSNLGLGSAAVINAPSSGNATSAQVVLGNDTRLSDQRPPPYQSITLDKLDPGLIAAISMVVLKQRYPVGEIFITRINLNPSDILGFGTWVRYGQGRALTGYNDIQAFNGTFAAAVDGVGGDIEVTLNTNNLPSHSHVFDLRYTDASVGAAEGAATQGVHHPNTTITQTTGTTGANVPVSILQPYVVVFFWRRIADSA